MCIFDLSSHSRSYFGVNIYLRKHRHYLFGYLFVCIYTYIFMYRYIQLNLIFSMLEFVTYLFANYLVFVGCFLCKPGIAASYLYHAGNTWFFSFSLLSCVTGGLRPVGFGHKKEVVFVYFCGTEGVKIFVPATYLQLQGRHLLEKKID